MTMCLQKHTTACILIYGNYSNYAYDLMYLFIKENVFIYGTLSLGIHIACDPHRTAHPLATLRLAGPSGPVGLEPYRGTWEPYSGTWEPYICCSREPYAASWERGAGAPIIGSGCGGA